MKCIHGIRRRRRTLAKLIGAVIFWYVSMVIRLLHCLDEYTWGVLATAVVGSILFVCVRLLAIRVGKTSGKRLCLQLGWLSIRRGEPRPTDQPASSLLLLAGVNPTTSSFLEKRQGRSTCELQQAAAAGLSVSRCGEREYFLQLRAPPYNILARLEKDSPSHSLVPHQQRKWMRTDYFCYCLCLGKRHCNKIITVLALEYLNFLKASAFKNS